MADCEVMEKNKMDVLRSYITATWERNQMQALWLDK